MKTRDSIPLIIAFLLTTSVAPAAEPVDYVKQIKPMLTERCYSCHGALKQKAELRLDTVASMLKGGEDGPVIRSGDAEKSLLLARITTTDLEERMPPKHEGEPFTAEQVKLLRDWIAAGAPSPADEKPESDPREHWAFRQRARPPVPVVARTKWVRNPIDAFIAKQHETHGLTPQKEAPREILLRRLYLDLVGVPPTLDEIAAMEKDATGAWYEETVTRLLDDRRHGERWARHWMDIWRYSDWWGLGEQLRNSQKHIWHWRDWIVESLNANTPYDEMVRQMLAADELYPNDLQKLRATGFLARNYFLFNRHQWMEETVEHVSKGLLGLTMNCAKCHDHKYDPIAQPDFYKMRAFFEPYHVRLDMAPGEADLARDGIPRVYDGLPETPTFRFVRGEESRPDKSKVIAPGVPAFLAFKDVTIQPLSLPAEAWQPERRAWVLDAHLSTARRNVESTRAGITKAKEKLALAEKRQADPSAPAKTPTSPDAAKTAVDGAWAELHVAELALTSAKAELASAECRAEAMRASWTKAGADPEKAADAVHAERAATVAKARHSVADAELRLLRGGDKKATIEKELKAAQSSLEIAATSLDAPVKPDEKFTRFFGAKWTPTRFLNSTKDDPDVPFPAQSTGRRSALAEWITDARNPLTARVAVNHIWMRHMGTPLVGTVFEFGRKGTPPTHPELLDWLASELVDSGWNMKHLHRLIVTSAAYRMSSSLVGGEASAAKDPDNAHLWRRAPIRLDAQVVRDSILAFAGELDLTMGGPSIPPGSQEESKRRSLYFFHSNNERNLFLTTFDDAAVKECYRRDQSIVPQQALALTNSRLVLDASRKIAERLSPSSPDDAAFVRQAFAFLLGIRAGESEIATGTKAMAAWQKLNPAGADATVASRANLVWALLNHNDFVTLR